MSKEVSASTSSSFSSLLLVLFVGLKLTHYIAWSWWWVISPLWIPIVFFLGVALFWLIAAFLLELMD